MSPDTPTPQPSGRERREYYRITVTLPICLQQETAETEGTLVERSVNISAGGLGVTLDQAFEGNEILFCTLLLPDQMLFKSHVEVLRVDSIAYPLNTYRLHAASSGWPIPIENC